jgi:hypothetical protein
MVVRNRKCDFESSVYVVGRKEGIELEGTKLEANITRVFKEFHSLVWLMSQPVRKLLLVMCDWLQII